MLLSFPRVTDHPSPASSPFCRDITTTIIIITTRKHPVTDGKCTSTCLPTYLPTLLIQQTSVESTPRSGFGVSSVEQCWALGKEEREKKSEMSDVLHTMKRRGAGNVIIERPIADNE